MIILNKFDICKIILLKKKCRWQKKPFENLVNKYNAVLVKFEDCV
jgi:hypothetical protein